LPADLQGPSYDVRARFQVSIWQLMVLTALVAWGIGWGGGRHAWSIAALAGLALIEAGCFKHEKLLSILLRNMTAFFVCSVVVGLVGFGLMCGRNPTGYFGISRFVTFPYGQEAVEFVTTAESWRFLMLRALPLHCAIAAGVMHWAMAGRVRWPAYLLLWIALSGFIVPILGSWTWGNSLGGLEFADDEVGWLAAMGYEGYPAIGLTFMAIGFGALSASYVLRPRYGQPSHRLGVFSPTGDRRFVAAGAALLWLLWVPIQLLVSTLQSSGDQLEWEYYWAMASPGVAGLAGAAIVSLPTFRRFDFALFFYGGLGGVFAMWTANYIGQYLMLLGEWVVPPLIGLVAGMLVVATAWVLKRASFDDAGGGVALFAVPSVGGVAFLTAYGLLLGQTEWSSAADQKAVLLQAFALIVAFVWTVFWCMIVFAIIQHAPGFRVPASRWPSWVPGPATPGPPPLPAAAERPMPAAPARKSWAVRGSSLLGLYRVDGHRALALTGDATLFALEDGSVILRAHYDPPGSAFFALLATVVASLVSAAMLAAAGFYVTPGWIVWYILIVLLRRQPVDFNLANATSVTIDWRASRVGFLIKLGSRYRWVAVELRSEFASAENALRAAFPETVRDGRVRGPNVWPVVFLVAVILGAFGFTVGFLLKEGLR